jgi:galactokinase
VLVNTKVKRELAGSKYSERVQETQLALEQVKMINPSVTHFRDITLNDVAKLQDSVIQKRMKHFVLENERVNKTADAFSKKDIAKVGELLLESHYSLKDDYEVSCPELDFLVEKSKIFGGCLGGRMMGGGFGGCTINLLAKNKLQEFSTYILPLYKKEFNIEGEIFAFDMVDGAKVF